MRKQLKTPSSHPAAERGFTLIEVLVTFIVLAIGLLGLAQLMARMHSVEMESYQRSQAVLLMQDMASRVAVAGQNASSYVTGTSQPLGTSYNDSTLCAATSGPSYDMCIWSKALKGAGETTNSGANLVGAMIGARGCIEQIQALNAASGVCQAGIYRVSVVWQGLTPTVAPSNLACGQNLYGNNASQDNLRRAVSTKVTIGTPAC